MVFYRCVGLALCAHHDYYPTDHNMLHLGPGEVYDDRVEVSSALRAHAVSQVNTMAGPCNAVPYGVVRSFT